jgi:hypothetical protein
MPDERPGSPAMKRCPISQVARHRAISPFQQDQTNPRTGKLSSRWIQLRGEYAVRASVTCRVNAWRDTLERFGAL